MTPRQRPLVVGMSPECLTAEKGIGLYGPPHGLPPA